MNDLSALWKRDGATRLRHASPCEHVSGTTVFSTHGASTRRFVLEKDHQVCALASTYRADIDFDRLSPNPSEEALPRPEATSSGAFVVVNQLVVADFVDPSEASSLAVRLLFAAGPRQAIETGTHYAATGVEIPASRHPHVSPLTYLQHITWALGPEARIEDRLSPERCATECGFRPYCFEKTRDSTRVLLVWTNPVL